MNLDIQEEIYCNGDEWFEGLRTAIQSAQKFIYFESYIFKNDEIGKQVLGLFKQAAARGVRVQIIVDGIGAPSWNSNKIFELGKENIEVRVYHPPPWLLSEPWFIKYFQVRNLLQFFGRINKRNHRKTLIVDGQTAIIGSINVADCHSKKIYGEKSWRDTAVFAKTNEIDKLIIAFDYTWKCSWCIGLKWHPLFPEPPQRSTYFMIKGSLRSRLYYYRMLLDQVKNAKTRIYITNPYFVPHARLLIALKKAAKRGVDVRVIVPFKIDITIVKWASLTFYKEMLASGIRIFEFKPNFLHAKTMIIDDWAIIGSSNLNNRSFMHDLELDAILHSEKAQKKLLEFFHADLLNSVEVDKKDLGRRSWYDKILSSFAIALRYWL